MYWKRVASVGVISLLLLPGHKAWADTGLGGFGYINEGPTTARPAPPPRSKRTKQKREIAIPVPPAPAPWGPVPTKQVSIVNVAPVLLPYFNNGPVFGVPGTVTGDFWSRTQVTGDWGGCAHQPRKYGRIPRCVHCFGVGYYYNVVSNDFKSAITNLTLGQSSANNEQGFEVFYDFAITPAIRLIPGYQHIWNPVAAQVSTGTTHADIFLTRLTVAW
jgi:porin